MERVGIAFCDCRLTRWSEAAALRIGQSVAAGEPAVTYVRAHDLCSADGIRCLDREVRSRALARVVVAGCPAGALPRVASRVAAGLGLPATAVAAVDTFPPAAGRVVEGGEERSSDRAASAIVRAARGLALVPDFATETFTLEPRVLVVGGSATGRTVAAETARLGHQTVLVEPEEDGERGLAESAASARSAVADSRASADGGPTLVRGSLARLEGELGRFVAILRTASGVQRLVCGAVVFAEEASRWATGVRERSWVYGINRVLSLEDLRTVIERMEPRRGHRSVALVLDLEREETTASTRQALELALAIQRQGRLQSYILAREMRIAAEGLWRLYEEAREAGAVVVRHDGELAFEDTDRGVVIRCTDMLMGQRLELACELVGVSRLGLAAPLEGPAAGLMPAIGRDAHGQLQQNNPRLFPELTDRPGIFVAGPGRGVHEPERAAAEARAAALAIHALLAEEGLTVELSQPVVDGERCALCLTCVRACPYGAMRVDREKSAAFSVARVCQRCGTCVGDCPAKAITFPAWPLAMAPAGANAAGTPRAAAAGAADGSGGGPTGREGT